MARFKAISSPEAEPWLNALPSVPLGTLLDSEVFRIAISLGLDALTCFPLKCK